MKKEQLRPGNRPDVFTTHHSWETPALLWPPVAVCVCGGGNVALSHVLTQKEGGADRAVLAFPVALLLEMLW